MPGSSSMTSTDACASSSLKLRCARGKGGRFSVEDGAPAATGIVTCPSLAQDRRILTGGQGRARAGMAQGVDEGDANTSARPRQAAIRSRSAMSSRPAEGIWNEAVERLCHDVSPPEQSTRLSCISENPSTAAFPDGGAGRTGDLQPVGPGTCRSLLSGAFGPQPSAAGRPLATPAGRSTRSLRCARSPGPAGGGAPGRPAHFGIF
jgi:hypothetical protein